MSDTSPDQIAGAEGVVKWFDGKKGYGFLIGPEGQDIFVHYTVIEGEGFRVLRDGATVIYDATKGEKGWRATKISRPAQDRGKDTKADTEEGPVVKVKDRNFSRSPRR